MELFEGKIYSIRYKDGLMNPRYGKAYIISNRVSNGWVHFSYIDSLDNDHVNCIATLQNTFDIEEVNGFVD
jgi:hypothetical protein